MAKRNTNTEQKEILEQRIKQASETIGNLNSIFSSAGTFAGILIVIIIAVVPVISYFYIVKPQNELQELVDNNITSYIKNNTQQRIDSAIANLESDDVIVAYRAMKVLEYYQPAAFNDYQILRIINIIRKTKDPKDRRLFENQLISLLIFQESSLVKEFFKQDLSREGYRDAAFLYFSRNENSHELLDVFITQNDKIEFFTELLTALGDQHKKFRLRIYNNQEFIDILLKDLNVQQIKMLYQNANNSYEFNDIKSTYYYKRITEVLNR
ncbi:MAG: hypothetical protein KF687_03780 [Cyclobacteriaceae bacterium]|nr:hypothetical protein [Cyclobacteriaceae bacterium]